MLLVKLFQVLLNIILPIFSIILLGYFLKLKNVIGQDYIKPANLLIYNVAIPAMLLSEISQAPFRANFNLEAVICVIAALVAIIILGLFLMKLLSVSMGRRATFVHSCFHGNIGYMSYAIAFYALGEGHFARMAILSSFLMLGQNLFGVWTLTTLGANGQSEGKTRSLLGTVFRSPIILTVLIGIVYSAVGFTIPQPLQKGLHILSGMAFPTALLLIGASLSFGSFRLMVKEIFSIGALKLLLMPALGYVLMMVTKTPESLILPGIILLASPPATITYVMATEMGGDPELAATSISIFTLASALSYALILSIFMP